MNKSERGIFVPILAIGIAILVAGIGAYQYKNENVENLTADSEEVLQDELAGPNPQNFNANLSNEPEIAVVMDQPSGAATAPTVTSANSDGPGNGVSANSVTNQPNTSLPVGNKSYRWVNIEVNSDKPIAAVAFEADFLSADSTKGLLTGYFNTEKNGQIDQSVYDRSLMDSFKSNPPNENGQPTFAFPAEGAGIIYSYSDFNPNPPFKTKNIISFRMDAWGVGVAKIKLSGIKLGLVDMEIVRQMNVASKNRDQLLWQELLSKSVVYVDINPYLTGDTYSDLGKLPATPIRDLYFEAKPESIQKKGN